MQRGEAMPQLDLEYTIKPLRANASESDIADHERNCNIVAAYEQARLDALESSHRFGEALLDARIGTLEQILLQERNALKETQRAIDAINAERKTAQLRAGERLFASERELHALCVKNVELSRVVQQLQAEVDELQLRSNQ
jgi:hypothetical protein